MKTFTNCAEKKANQLFNLLQGYTKGIRMTAILVLLLMGVSNAWANGDIGYKGVKFTKNSTTTGWYNIHNVTWDYAHSSYECRSGKSGVTNFNNADLGVVTSLKLHSFVVIGWTDNSDWVSGQLKYRTYLQSATAGNYNVYNVGNYETYCDAVDVLVSSGNNRVVGKNGTMNITLVDNNTTPGQYYLQLQGMGRMRYCNGDFNTNDGSAVRASYTVPGFTKTTATQDFGSVGMESNSSKTISFTNHYGTTLTTSNCVLSGTNKSEFSVTSINETGVTVKFTPSSSGSKTATLTITDAHSKECTITLSGTATPPTYTVTFNANGHGTAPDAQTVIQGDKATEPTAPTATGYTFGGWYREEGCTNAFDFNTAINANITLYAKWTINQYTLTYSAGEGGSVTGNKASGAKYDYNTSITLTAKPEGENAFAQWVDEDGIKVSTINPYTFKLTGNTTLKAEFSKPTTVYLKPSSAWKEYNAHFAIYSWGESDSWVEMEEVDCEGDYYKANVPAGFSDFAFVRLKPAGADGYSSTNGGLNWNNKWDQTGNLSVQTNGKNMYDIDDKTVSYIHLKPNDNWKSAGARFAAYFFNNTGNKWVNLTLNGDVYTCKKPAGYTSVIFCRMKPGTSNGWGDDQCWNKTKDLTILNDGNNCFSINQDDWGCSGSGDGNANGANGEWFRVLDDSQWKTFTTPTYPLTLKATPYGEYTVKCNGVSHTSSRTKDIVIDLPVGATVEITKAESYDAAYNNDLVIKTSSNSQYEDAKLNTTYTFCGATTIEENFTTIAGHTVFLRVPTGSVGTSWNKSGANYIWHRDRLGGVVATMTEADANDIKQESGYAYFKATVPAGHREFRFERKTAENAEATNYTEYFEHLLPLGQSNCFTLDNNDGNMFYGNWGLSTANGDYRILYVEQKVAHGTGADDWKTVIDTTYQHASDIIKKGDGATIVSLHIDYDEKQHPEVILQKFTNGEWVDVEGQAHMVLGPLTASADMAMLPGRRNTEGDVNLRYGDGIEKIKADAANGKEGRVWNFVVQQSDASAHIDFTAETFAPYEGNYYIRTDNAAGGWMTYAIPGNVMSHSDYSLVHSGYSHYFCKWVETSNKPNTKFVVANEYGAAISDTLSGEFDENGNLLSFTDEDGNLTEKANVRWMWNEYTNKVSRAYIAGSTQDDFLKVFYEDSKSKKFDDKGEWVYEVDLTDVEVGKKLTNIKAMYQGKEQQLLEKTHQDAGGVVMLASTSVTKSIYTVRVVYDFKINQTLLYLLPTDQPVSTSIDVIIERINQDEGGNATQVKANITPANAEGLTVYGLITLTQDHITDPNKSEQEALTYWISFPFDVKIGDITGFGEVGKHWMIKYYDGAERAAKGWFLDTKTFWKFFLDTEDVMKANTGYVLTLNKSLLNESNPVYDNTKILKLYFPSMNKIKDDITSGWTETSVTLKPLECTITSPADRTVKDSHWNLIGVPSYAHKTNNKSVKFFYDYDFHEDKYSAEMNAGPETFHAMHAYMVQFAGTIDWSTFTTTPAQLAAKKNADAEEQYTLRLELQQNGTKADQTFVELHDDATTMFDMNVDLTKMFNASSANIYTLIGSDNQVAANVMPIANTVIPVGVQIATAGEYTFAMPDGTDGITVELIDYETNTRTNLLLSEYTVDLNAGTFETRFALHVKPSNVTTSIDPVPNENGQVRKILMNGQLYLLKDGQLYDAQGRCVQ